MTRSHPRTRAVAAAGEPAFETTAETAQRRVRRRPRTGLASWLGVLFLLGACSGDKGDVSPKRPVIGRWQLIEFDGEIRSQFGGRPVLCLQGSLQRRPAPLYTGPEEVRSWLDLHSDGELDFAFFFEDGSQYDLLSTDPQQPPQGFFGEAFGRDPPHTNAAWSWSERTVEGTLETVPTVAGARDNRARFTLQGRFEGPRQIAGEWVFQASSETGSCWGREAGRGEFRAAPTTD